MSCFRLGQTDFGVDDDASRLEVGPATFTLEVRGDPDRHAEVTTDGSEWDWTLHPPYFYLRDYPRPPGDPSFTVDVSLGAADDYDIALYLSEHHDVTDLSIHVDASRTVRATGTALMPNARCSFVIEWRPDNDTVKPR